MTTIDVVAFPDSGITIKPTHDQFTAWSISAGESPVADWLAEIADEAAVRLQYDKRTFPVVLELQHPIEFGSQRITKLELRRGKLGDMKGITHIGGISIDQMVTIAARQSNQPTQVIDRLSPEDAGEVMSIVMDFYGRSLGAVRTR